MLFLTILSSIELKKHHLCKLFCSEKHALNTETIGQQNGLGKLVLNKTFLYTPYIYTLSNKVTEHFLLKMMLYILYHNISYSRLYLLSYTNNFQQMFLKIFFDLILIIYLF